MSQKLEIMEWEGVKVLRRYTIEDGYGDQTVGVVTTNRNELFLRGVTGVALESGPVRDDISVRVPKPEPGHIVTWRSPSGRPIVAFRTVFQNP